jgi:hypothetical protein
MNARSTGVDAYWHNEYNDLLVMEFKLEIFFIRVKKYRRAFTLPWLNERNESL